MCRISIYDDFFVSVELSFWNSAGIYAFIFLFPVILFHFYFDFIRRFKNSYKYSTVWRGHCYKKS